MRGVSCEMPSSCIQGGPRPLGGFQPAMMEPSSPPTAWQYHPMITKPEPMDLDTRNDSGMASGSEYVSSSPGSDRSENLNLPYTLPRASQAATSMPSSAYYSSPLTSQPGYPQQQNISPHLMYNNNEHNPLTPPSSESMMSPKMPIGGEKAEVPRHHNPPTPPVEENSAQPADQKEPDGHLRKLQMALEKNGLLPSVLSPKPSECSVEDDKSEKDSDEGDDQSLRVPKVNSQGKVKKFKCKQCDFFAITKMDYWEHNKTHIKAGKALSCPKCPFVTEYKHHLEYHLRNHVGSKPFKCNQCSYSCVNQSMLNSHMKSHSNVYQYRCATCNYATKYCHSLKLHLRKNRHSPAMVLNPDGTPNPLPIIDVYGTRRGPKMKNPEQRHVEEPSSHSPPNPEAVVPFPLNQLLMNASNMTMPFPFPFFSGIPNGANPLLMQMERMMRERQVTPPVPNVLEGSPPKFEEDENESGVLDLSKPETPNTNRRKGSPSKFTPTRINSFEEDEDEDRDTHTTIFDNVEVVENAHAEDSAETTEVVDKSSKNHCQYCDITFGDPIMHTIHMGYHGYNHPYTCNICGERCDNRITFFVHIARTSHM